MMGGPGLWRCVEADIRRPSRRDLSSSVEVRLVQCSR